MWENLVFYAGKSSILCGISMKNPLTYQIIDKKPLNAEKDTKLLRKKIRQNMNLLMLTNKT